MAPPTNTPNSVSPWPRRLTIALLAIAAVLAALWFYARAQQPEEDGAVIVPSVVTPAGAPPEVASNFSGTDHNGKRFEFASTEGKVTALFFGFTHCPDTCPLTLSYLERARQQLPAAQRDDVQVVFVTLDPARDPPARLKEYVGFYGDNITGVYVPEPDLQKVAGAYGVTYAKGDVKSDDEYQIFHSSSTLLLGRDGQPRMMYSQVPTVDRLVEDYQKALSQ